MKSIIFIICATRILLTGILAPLLFWVIVFTGGMINVDYNHLRNTISELGMIGAPAEKFMLDCINTIGHYSHWYFLFCFLSAVRYFRISVLPAVLSFCMPLSILWAAIFPMGNYLHDKQGPLPLFLLLGMLLALFLWPKREFYYGTVLERIGCL